MLINWLYLHKASPQPNPGILTVNFSQWLICLMTLSNALKKTEHEAFGKSFIIKNRKEKQKK